MCYCTCSDHAFNDGLPLKFGELPNVQARTMMILGLSAPAWPLRELILDYQDSLPVILERYGHFPWSEQLSEFFVATMLSLIE